MTLFRPVGLAELKLIFGSEFEEFPPRFDWQPIFYPVLNEEYAKQIAMKWNTKDKNSQYSGFITRFDILDSYIRTYESYIVGASIHEEYWIPAEKLSEFNSNIKGKINVNKMYYGPKYSGVISHSGIMGNKSLHQQFEILCNLCDRSLVDFTLEIVNNHETIYFNFPYWKNHQKANFDISLEKIIEALAMIEFVWNENGLSPELIKNSELIHQE